MRDPHIDRDAMVLLCGGVPFDLYVSRASSFAMLREPLPAVVTPKQGILSRLLSKPEAPLKEISRDEFHALMASAPATRQADDLYWVRHGEGDPWFAAEWQEEGLILLSTSYTNHRFLRNLGDMFDQGLRMAGELKARLFEEAGETEVTSANVDALLAVDGDYLRLQAGTWRSALEKLDTEANAALEYPLGPIDCVSEFMIFHVTPSREASIESLRSVLDARLSGAKTEVVHAMAAHVVGFDDDRGLAKVLLRPDRDWQIWPSHGQATFARIATAVVEAAECIHDEVGGEIAFRGRPYDEELKRVVRSRLTGLAVDFYRWANDALPEDAGGSSTPQA